MRFWIISSKASPKVKSEGNLTPVISPVSNGALNVAQAQLGRRAALVVCSLVLGLYFGSFECKAATNYVSTTGGSGAGTAQDPWSLSYALSHASPGNTLVFLPGTYAGPISFPTRDLTMRSQVKWGARIVGGGNIMTVTTSTKTNCVIDGFELTGSTSSGVYITAHYTTVRNCWIHHCGVASGGFNGIEAHDLLGTMIENNLIEYCGDPNSYHGHGVYMNGTNITLRGNVLRYNRAAGAQIYRSMEAPPGGNPEEGSLNVKVYGNLVYGNFKYCFSLGSQYGRSYDFWNNTLRQDTDIADGTQLSSMFYIGQVSPCTIVNATNNIIVGACPRFLTGCGQVRGDYNLLGSAWFSQAHGVITNNAHFVDTVDGLYWLQADSPARGRALSTSCGPLDFWGNAQASVTDLGAFQYSQAYAADTRTLDPSANVVPDYWAVLGPTYTGTPVMSITPGSQNFGSILVGTAADRTFTVQNAGTGTLSGSATVPPPFTIIAGTNYNLGAGESQAVTVRYSPTTAGNANQNLTFSGPSNVVATVTGVATNASVPPIVSALAQNTGDVDPVSSGLQVYAGSAVQYSGSASDPGGNSLSWRWSYAVNGGAETVISSGTGAVSSVAFTYNAADAGKVYVWKLQATSSGGTAQSTLAVGVVAPPTVTEQLTFAAAAGVITAPFTVTSGYLSQPSATSVTGGGSAVYPFTVTTDGAYVIQAVVNAANTNQNSFFVNVDSQPSDPIMIWDIPVTSGFEPRLISWRGNGNDTSNQFVPAVFRLTKGTHQLVIRGREANTLLQSLSILQTPPPPVALRVASEG